MRSDDLHVGAFVQLPTPDGPRRVEVVNIDESGFTVRWFSPEGLGPYQAHLPHGAFPRNAVHKVHYADERAGLHKSFWETHSDFTGKTGEF